MKRLIAAAGAAAVMVFFPAANIAQTNPMMDSVKSQHNIAKGNLLKTAEKVPENLWSFRPSPDVRTFGEIIGHIADSSVGICSSASGEKPAPLGAGKMTTKAQLSKALADAMAACDKAIASLDDKRAMEVVPKFFTGPTTRGMIIAFNTAHNFEHYGNLVTYMRINKIVPPSSEGTGQD